MPSLRTLGSAPVSSTQTDSGNENFYFVRVDIASPVGTQRFTDYDGGDFTVDVGDGAGAQLFSSAVSLTVANLNQSEQPALAVSSISFGNIDTPPSWTSWSNTLAASSLSLRGTRCRIWRVIFDTTGAAYANPPLVYDGKFDNHELGDLAHFALVPNVTPWAKQTPWAVPGPLCIYPYKDPLTCQYGRMGTNAVLQCVAASTQYVDCGSSATLRTVGDMTFTAWIKRSALATAMFIAGNETNNASGESFRITSGNKLVLQTNQAGANVSTTSTNALPGTVNDWIFVVASRSGTTVSFYFNGALDSAIAGNTAPVVATASFKLGASAALTTTFGGQLSHVRFHDSALSATDILNIYNGVTITATPKGRWKLEDGTGTTAADDSGNGNTGTLTNTPTWIAEPGGETTCPHTRLGCTNRGNQAHFGGFDLMPKAGEIIRWGSSQTNVTGAS